MKRNVVAACVCGAGLLLVAISTAGRPSAQEATATAPSATSTPTPSPTPTAYPFSGLKFGLLARADISVDSDGPFLVSAATITMPPGAATMTFTVEGDTVIAVQAGQVTVDADNGSISVLDVAPVIGIIPVAGTPGPISEAVLPAGQQVFLPAGTTATLRNRGSAAATILVLAVTPATTGTDAGNSGQ
jgi:hypothetical protein